MEMRNPHLLLAGLALTALLLIVAHAVARRKASKYEGGPRAANTHYAKALPEYASRRKRWKLAMTLVEGFLAVTLVGASLAVARPCETFTEEGEEHKRDIFLCLDVSYSIFSQNEMLVSSLKDFVRGLDGERFGISIFNSSSVVYVPMTDDYEYVISMLDELERYFKMQIIEVNDLYGDGEAVAMFGLDPSTELPEPDPELQKLHDDDPDEWTRQLLEVEAGTMSGASRGSSLIGEGLATCLYSFPHLDDEDRTRVIILSTDNDDASWRQDVDLRGAGKLCAKHGVTVYGVLPTEADLPMGHSGYEGAKDELDKVCQGTGGRMYVAGQGEMDVEDAVADIESREAKVNREPASRHTVDHPEVPLALIMVGIAGMLVTVGVLRPW